VAGLTNPLTTITRADVLRLRRRALIKSWKGKVILVNWPRPRGKKSLTHLQLAWVDRFACLAGLTKSPHPKTLAAATDLAKGTGWYYRDVIHSAMTGKLMGLRNEIKVRTPTVMAHRRVSTSMVPDNNFLIPNGVDWDTNNFWNAGSNPGRLTFLAPGLYLIGADVWTGEQVNQNKHCYLKLNGTTFLYNQLFSAGANYFGRFNPTGIWYMHTNDYIELGLSIPGAGNTYQINAFYAIGIAPETLIP